MKKMLPFLLGILIIIFGFIFITMGSVKIPLKYVLGMEKIPEYMEIIIFNIRLPRILMAILIGMMLSTSGAVVQTIFQNPLADPYIIGISASAVFGAVIAYVFNLPDIMYGILAFIFSVASTFGIFKIAKKGNSVDVTSLLIIGVAVSSFLGAFTSFSMYLIGENSFRITMWIMGYLGDATWSKVIILFFPLLCSLIYFYMKRNELDALLSGDEEAFSLGVDTNKLKLHTLAVASLITAFSVAFSGMIGFVGLIIPHIVRNFVGASNGKLLPNTALGGGLFLLVCDTLGRTLLAPVEIPIGVITAFFGAPFFLYLALKKGKGF